MHNISREPLAGDEVVATGTTERTLNGGVNCMPKPVHVAPGAQLTHHHRRTGRRTPSIIHERNFDFPLWSEAGMHRSVAGRLV
jgi:hypothetical protein